MNFFKSVREKNLNAQLESLINELAQQIKDYRAGELSYINAGHVEKWARQFPVWEDRRLRIIFMKELVYILKRTYYSHKKTLSALRYINKLVTPKSYIASIQKNGASQKEILELMRSNNLLPPTSPYNGENVVFYIDDFIFTGNRFLNDIRSWLAKQKEMIPEHLIIKTAVIADHEYARYSLNKQKESLSGGLDQGIRIEFQFNARVTYENRNSYRNNADVLWPVVRPEDPMVEAYLQSLEQQYAFEPRIAGKGRSSLFRSEQGRQLLERQFLWAGLKIRSLSKKPDPILKPLGYGPYSFGFGSMLVSYRNCPNTTPLALWWGNPDVEEGHPLSKWYPLFPRKTYDA